MFHIYCPCGCLDTVEARDAGFAATTVEVTACAKLRAEGVVSTTIRKSRALALASMASRPTSLHPDALVVFA